MLSSEDCRRRDLQCRRLAFVLTCSVCVSHSDIKITLLEIAHLVFVTEDKAIKNQDQVLLACLFNTISTEGRIDLL